MKSSEQDAPTTISPSTLTPIQPVRAIKPGLEVAAELREARAELVRGPQVRLSQLRKLDEQLMQQLDGLAAAGRSVLDRRAAELDGTGDLFTHAVLALQFNDQGRIDELLAQAERRPAVESAMASALGWVSAPMLQGRLREWLGTRSPTARRLALAACTMHRVDPGALLLPCLQSPDPTLRAAAARAAASLGRTDVIDLLVAALDDPPPVASAYAPADAPAVVHVDAGDDESDDGPESEFPSTEVLGYDDELGPGEGASGRAATAGAANWPSLPPATPELGHAEAIRRDTRGWAAWAAVLLGDRGAALATLQELALGDSPFAGPALPIYVRACDINEAHDVLRTLTRRSGATARRRLIQSCGAVGDPLYLPWLMDMMTEDAWARLAGESFALITGADLTALDLVRPRPDGLPTTRPGEYLAEADPGRIDDVPLPWPDRHSVATWWSAQQQQFRVGRRYFMGHEPTADRVVDVLYNGFQRQRAAAALWLALLRPGSKLFPVRALARRQKRWLAELAPPPHPPSA